MVPHDRYELIALRVSAETRRQYDAGLKHFLDYLVEKGKDSFNNMALLDGYLTDFAVYTYHKYNKANRQRVANAMLAVELYFPEIRGKLILIRASLEGWAKDSPPVPRKIICLEVAWGIAIELLYKSRPDMATAVLVSFECYLRAADIRNMKYTHYLSLDPPQGPEGTYHGIITLPKTKRGRNESVYVRDKLIAVLMERQKQVAKLSRDNEQQVLFTFNLATLRKRMKIALARFGIDLGNTALHGLRYGGATTDDMLGRLTRDEIQQRGRWASPKSMKSYLQPDQAHAQLAALSEQHLRILHRRQAQRYRIFNVTPPPGQEGGGNATASVPGTHQVS